jgi:tryptophan-rich sensory protein
MQLEEITLALFAACNSARVLAYLPQIHKVAIDRNGASAISRTTWSMFLVAHVSTIAYALVNRSDPWLALCFAGNALCCVVILAIAWWKVRSRASPARGRHSIY